MRCSLLYNFRNHTAFWMPIMSETSLNFSVLMQGKKYIYIADIYHRIVESFQLEGTLKGHLVQLPCNKHRDLQVEQVLRAPSSLTLTVSRDRTSILSLSNLCQCFTNLIIKHLSISNLYPIQISPLLVGTHFPFSYHNRYC